MKERYALYKLIKGESNYRKSLEKEESSVSPPKNRIPVGGQIKRTK